VPPNVAPWAHPARRCSPWRVGRAARALLAGAALASAACGAPRDDDLYGMSLEVESSQAWATSPELRRRVHALIGETAAHVGLDTSLLYGWTIRIVDGPIPCGEVARARGCTWMDDGMIAVSTLAWVSTKPLVPCIEDTPLPHELLHVKIADAKHSDPRWESALYWEPLFDRLSREDCSGEPAVRIW
jgi:hypothetical protein